MKAYTATVYDCAGEFDFKSTPTFEACLAMVAELSARYPDKIIMVTSDNCDYDHDGLTEEQRDAIDEARG